MPVTSHLLPARTPSLGACTSWRPFPSRLARARGLERRRRSCASCADATSGESARRESGVKLSSGCRAARARSSANDPKQRPQLVLGPFESRPLGPGQPAARPIDVEGEHGHRGPERAGFPATAAFGGAFQGAGDRPGIVEREHARLEVERPAALGHALGPALALGRRHAGRAPGASLPRLTAQAPAPPRRGAYIRSSAVGP